MIVKTNSELNNLLYQLKLIASSSTISKRNILSTLEDLLSWLNKPQNNTDSNCRQIDYYVSYEILPQKEYQEMPEEIKSILFDMGATLHDTHSSPEVAENFESTPAQLLKRVQNLM